jgi:hypothetical protein
MKPETQDGLVEALGRFFDLFEPTLKVAADLVNRRANAQEIVLLLCARLDALASAVTAEDQPNRQAFIRLVITSAGHRDLMESVSVGDLYYELGYHRWLMEGLIPKPGRIYRFSRLNDPVIQLLDRSGIPLTQETGYRFLTRIMEALSKNFRCRPGQRLTKPSTAHVKAILNAVEAQFQSWKDPEVRENVGAAIKPLLELNTVAGILYSKFRNNAVHGVKVEVDDSAFFRESAPYWQPLYSEFYPPFYFIKFPARFLIRLVQNCIQTLRQKFLAAGKLPPDIHTIAFGYDIDARTDLLDTKLLGEGRYIRLQNK